MAFSSERFSIREYTLKMRSTDLLKCWPFPQANPDLMEAYLPPITIHKFKWWADELRIDVDGLTCPVCSAFRAPTMKALMAHVADECIAQSSRKEQSKLKAKSRVPKKRSIVEIFAVAPQVENVYEEDEEDDSSSDQEDDSSDVKLSSLIRVSLNEKRMRKVKLKEGSFPIASKVKRGKKVKKNCKQKERDGASIELAIPDKEKSLKLKQKYPLTSAGNCCSSSHTLGLEKELLDSIHFHKKKFRPKLVMTGKKTSTEGTSKQQKSVMSVRGILKDNSKVTLGSNSSSGTSKEPSEANWCDIQQPDRRVSFSDKDDILEQKKRSVIPQEFPTMHNTFCSYSETGAASLETVHSAERGVTYVPVEVNGKDRSTFISKEYENRIQSITGKTSSGMCLCASKPNSLRPLISQEQLSNRPVPLNKVAYRSENLHWLEHGNRVALHDPSAYQPGFLSMEEYGPNSLIRGCQNLSVAYDSYNKVIAHHGGPSCRNEAMRSKDYVTAFSPRPSPSPYFTNNDDGNRCGRHLYPSDMTLGNCNGQNLQYRPFGYVSPKELIQSICFLPELEQRGVTTAERLNQDYVRLPLNSQGEYIQQNSSGKGGFNQLMQPCTITDSSRTLALWNELPSDSGDHLSYKICGERPTSSNQIQFFPVLDRAKENLNFLAPSSVGFSELQGPRSNTPIDYLRASQPFHLNSGVDVMNTGHMNRQDQIWNHSEDGNMHQQRNPDLMPVNVTHPTMRLMGQEFSVGNIYRNLHEDGNVWMDKQMIAEHTPASTHMNNSFRTILQPDLIMQPTTGKGKEIACSSEFHFNVTSHSFLQTKPPEPRFSQSYLSCQTDAVYETAYRNLNSDHVTRSFTCYPPDSSSAIFNKAPIFQEPLLCEYEPLPVNHQPIRASYPQSTFQNTSLCMRSDKKQKQPHSSSIFDFPFSRADLGEHVWPSCCRSSSNSLPPWLLDATQEKETIAGSFQSYPDAGGSHHSITMSHNNCQKFPSVCCISDAPYAYNPLAIQPPLQNTPGLASVNHSPPVPVRHRFPQNSTMNNRREYRMKFKERMKPELCTKDPAGKKTKKRYAPKLVYSKSNKLPNMEVSEGFSCSGSAFRHNGDAGVDVHGKRNTFDLDLAKDSANGMECGQNTTQKDATKAFTEIDQFKLDGIARPGPIILAAGTKHIFKPSEIMDQSNSRLTHPQIPSATVTSPGAISETQIKSAQIYRF